MDEHEVPNMDVDLPSEDVPLGEMSFCFLAIVLAVAGLVMVSFAGGWYWPGLVVFLLAVLGGFYSVKRYYDRWEAIRRQRLMQAGEYQRDA